MQLALVEKGLPHPAAGHADKQHRAVADEELGGEPGQHQRHGIDAGKYGLGIAQRIQPGREGLDPGECGEQQFFIAPAGLGAPQRDGRGQRRIVEILAEAPLQQGGAIATLDIGNIFELEAFFGNVREQVKQA